MRAVWTEGERRWEGCVSSQHNLKERLDRKRFMWKNRTTRKVHEGRMKQSSSQCPNKRQHKGIQKQKTPFYRFYFNCSWFQWYIFFFFYFSCSCFQWYIYYFFLLQLLMFSMVFFFYFSCSCFQWYIYIYQWYIYIYIYHIICFQKAGHCLRGNKHFRGQQKERRKPGTSGNAVPHRS